jgi:hypothetical protein
MGPLSLSLHWALRPAFELRLPTPRAVYLIGSSWPGPGLVTQQLSPGPPPTHCQWHWWSQCQSRAGGLRLVRRKQTREHDQYGGDPQTQCQAGPAGTGREPDSFQPVNYIDRNLKRCVQGKVEMWRFLIVLECRTVECWNTPSLLFQRSI